MENRALVMIVGDDAILARQAQDLLPDHRVLLVHSGEVAIEVAKGGLVDAVLLAPGLADQAHIVAGGLHAVDPRIPIALCADIVSHRVLRDALRTGLADVVELPLTEDSLSGMLGTAGTEVRVVMEREPATPEPTSGATMASTPTGGFQVWSDDRERPVA